MSSVRTYNPSVRVANWNEDLYLEEDVLKDFIQKRENNQLLVQRSTNLLKSLLKPVELSNPSDGYIHIGDAVCLMHIHTQSVLAAYMSAASAHEAKQLLPDSRLTCSTMLQPCPRNVFVIGSYGSSDAKIGDPVCYEQPITLTTLPNEGGQLSLESDMATFIEHSRYTREQGLKLRDKITYKCAWKILCFKPGDRLENIGKPVPSNELVLINHAKTNMNLAVHTEWKHRTPFGREYEVTASTKYNIHKVEDVHNHFMVVTGNIEELVPKPMK